MKRKYAYLASVLLIMTVMGSPTAHAGTPQLDMQVRSGLFAGRVADGTRLAQGVITYTDAHAGFQVWSEEPVLDGKSPRYVLSGSRHSGNKLRVRLEGEGWVANTEGGKGMQVITTAVSAPFDVVVDGDQMVDSDVWTVPIQGGILLFNNVDTSHE